MKLQKLIRLQKIVLMVSLIACLMLSVLAGAVIDYDDTTNNLRNSESSNYTSITVQTATNLNLQVWKLPGLQHQAAGQIWLYYMGLR